MNDDGYVKLFGSIITSTIWLEDHATFRVWMAILALKNAHGEVAGTIPGLAHVCRVTLEECEAAIAKFLAPDKYSRSQEHEGRRIERIDGGWRVLNHEKYRDMLGADDQRRKATERMRRHREKQAARDVTVTRGDAGDVTVRHTDTDQDLHAPDLPPSPEPPDLGGGADLDQGRPPVVVREVLVVPSAPIPLHARTGYERPLQRPPSEHRARLARDVVNYCALRHAELKGDGIDPTAPPIPIQHSPSDFGFNLLLDRVDEQLVQGDVELARETLRRRIDVAVAEARRDRSLKYFTLPRLFDPKSFAIAAAMSPEQAAAPRERAGPSQRSTTNEPTTRRLKPA